MIISRLELGNWKNFTVADVALARRVFIVGPNACGKSNLLDAIRFLRDLVTEGGGLAKAVEVRGGTSRVRSLFARSNSAARIAVSVIDDNGAGRIYDLAFNNRGPKDPIPTVIQERVEEIHSDDTRRQL